MARDTTSTLLDHGLEAPVRSPEVSEYPINTPYRRETLFQRVEEEEGPELTKAKFRELLKDLDRLYEEIIELITKTRDL
jgi:hypothetical protein